MLSLLLFSFRKSQPRPGDGTYLYLYTYFVAGISSHLHPIPKLANMHQAYTSTHREKKYQERGKGFSHFCLLKVTILPVDVFSCEQCVTIPSVPAVSEPGVPAVQKSQEFSEIFFLFAKYLPKINSGELKVGKSLCK